MWSQAWESERALVRVGTAVQKYRIRRLIGIGGMAAVYEATHLNGHRVAMKFLLERHVSDSGVQNLFRREAYLANKVEHPGAVPVLDNDVDDAGCPFLVMPLLEGETLRKRWERANKRLSLAEVAVFMSDALDVLASAHARGIVHRDIKPDNLFLTTEGEVHVLDFGIARAIEVDPSMTATGRAFGTPGFMPPEQAMGEREAIGPHSDCWAVGATMFALLSGEFVHNSSNAHAQLMAAATKPARSLAEVAKDVSSVIVKVVDKALAFDPKERFRTAAEMREALVRAWDEAALGESFAVLVRRIRSDVATEGAGAVTQDVGELETEIPVRNATRSSQPTKSSRFLRPGLSITALLVLIAAVAVRMHGQHQGAASAPSVAASWSAAPSEAATADPSAASIVVPSVQAPSANPAADAGASHNEGPGGLARGRGGAGGHKKPQTAPAASASSLRHGDLYDDDDVPAPAR